MEINYYELISDKDYLPKLKVIDTMEYSGESYDDIGDLSIVFSYLTRAREKLGENLYVVTYDYKGNINGIHHIATGHMTSVEIPVRFIATCIILTGAHSFKMFHNHTMENIADSESDRNCCHLFSTLGKQLECEYTGHYIITKEKCRCIETNEVYEFEEDEL